MIKSLKWSSFYYKVFLFTGYRKIRKLTLYKFIDIKSVKGECF